MRPLAARIASEARDLKVCAGATHRQNGLYLNVLTPQPEGRKIKAQCASTGRNPVRIRAPGRGGRTNAAVPSYAPFRGCQTPPACYPRLCAVGYYLSPFGLQKLRPIGNRPTAARAASLPQSRCGRRLHGSSTSPFRQLHKWRLRLIGNRPACPNHAATAGYTSQAHSPFGSFISGAGGRTQAAGAARHPSPRRRRYPYAWFQFGSAPAPGIFPAPGHAPAR